MKPIAQYLRGIAAVMVVLHHASLHIAKHYGLDPLAYVGHGNSLAYVGVNLFFCLSGYLMSALVQTTSLGVFAWHRVTRIYPAFFLAAGAAYFTSWVFSGQIPAVAWRSLSLLPLGAYGPLQVEWTLNYEITFYIMTAVFCLAPLRPFHGWFVVAWAVAIMAAILRFDSYGTSQFPTFYQLPFSTWTLSFAVGGIAFYAMRAEPVRSAVVTAGPYALLASAALGLAGYRDPQALTFVLPPVLAVGVAYAFSATPAWRINGLLRLGGHSYGIYLIHQVVCAFAMGLLAPHVPSPWVVYALLIGLSLHIGGLVGAADQASYAWLKAHGAPLLHRRRDQRAGRLGDAYAGVHQVRSI